MNEQRKTPVPPVATKRVYTEEIDLLDLLRHVLKFWPLLLLGFILGAGLLGGSRYLRKYTYTSSSTMYILAQTTSITSLTDLQIGTELSDDFTYIVQSKPVLDKTIATVEDKLNLTLERKDILNSLQVSHPDDTRILTISCTTTDAKLSKVMCQAITETSAERMSEITQTDPPTIVESAEQAETPNGRGVVTGAAKGACIGFVIVFVILCIPYLANNKIRRGEDVTQYLGEVVIGSVPYNKSLVYKGYRMQHKQQKQKKKS